MPSCRQRHDLVFTQGCLGRESAYVHSPLVLRIAGRGHSVDDDLALTDCQVTAIEQAGVEELEKQSAIAGQRGEQQERRVTAHHGVDGLLHVGR
jgi:hypothetical protein